jgi:hypothetical protein
VEEKISDIAKDYKTIVTAVPEFSQFSIEEFSHFRMLISSRIFGICVDGKKTDALVPLAGKRGVKQLCRYAKSQEASAKRLGVQ